MTLDDAAQNLGRKVVYGNRWAQAIAAEIGVIMAVDAAHVFVFFDANRQHTPVRSDDLDLLPIGSKGT